MSLTVRDSLEVQRIPERNNTLVKGCKYSNLEPGQEFHIGSNKIFFTNGKIPRSLDR